MPPGRVGRHGRSSRGERDARPDSSSGQALLLIHTMSEYEALLKEWTAGKGSVVG
jgi:hypothetical protein